ncbi:MAG: DNA polymerase III subunit gamma/tau [Mariniblastus sp.]|nr:DNA polymerase III subunit gamma/tau [Mariniblastus sp.]
MNSQDKPQDEQYQVVALRYRPKSFGDLVGQGHIATALSNAINKNRVGHAYLFTGARGVGKTSSARIFAKCLNCEKGPTMEPCNECDICQAVSSGEDVDVLEIDGASNRGIDEIRQLRSNAAVRPSRSKYKIYIIDEVHMLTMQAFNALLKTLEEPPLHVKFIFCTTDPQKIPITVLSRCQRFDFSPVQTNEIANRLREIAQAEGVSADEQALSLLARRANGSMRDSQSLLEQLFSFCGNAISVDEVNQLLGTADMGRIAEIATAMTSNDSQTTLNLIHRGVTEGVDSGQMADQLLGYFRDMMAIRVGCGEDTLLNCTAADVEQLQSQADELGLETILFIVQILDAAVVRMQASLHARTLLEAAAIRVCNLEKLDSLSDLVSSLSKSGGANKTAPSQSTPVRRPRVQMREVQTANSPVAEADSKKKEISDAVNPSGKKPVNAAVQSEHAIGDSSDTKVSSSDLSPETGNHVPKPEGNEPSPDPEKISPPEVSKAEADSGSTESDNGASGQTVTAANIEAVWKQVTSQMGEMTADMAGDYESLVLAEPSQLVVTLKEKISSDLCSRSDRKQKFESALEAIAGAKIRIDFLASKKVAAVETPVPTLTRQQQIRKLHDEEFVKKTIKLFDAEITGYREPLRTRKR